MLKLKKIPVKQDNGLDKMSDVIFAPNFSLNDKQMPEIKDWEVGESYTIIVEVKMKSINEYEQGGRNASFEIVAYKTLDDEDMSDEDMEELQAKGLSNK